MEELIRTRNALARLLILRWKPIALISAFLICSFALYQIFLFLNIASFLYRDLAEYALIYGVFGLVLSFFIYIAERLGLLTPAKTVTSELEVRLINLEAQLADSLVKSENEYEKHTDILKPELERISKDFFISETFKNIEGEIARKYGDGIDVGVKIREIKSVFEKSVAELADQLSVQRFNSNLNLFLGLIFATLGIAVLGYVFYGTYLFESHDNARIDLQSFLFGFIPRITFVVLVETVAFFFLSLYREDRNMIRYFRNEVTNFEAKFIALEAAARFGDNAMLSKVVSVFANTERNFTIKKGNRLITEVLREEDDRMFNKVIDKLSNSFDLSKLRKD